MPFYHITARHPMLFVIQLSKYSSVASPITRGVESRFSCVHDDLQRNVAAEKLVVTSVVQTMTMEGGSLANTARRIRLHSLRYRLMTF